MKDVMLNSIGRYQETFASSAYIIMFFVSLIFIILFESNKKKRGFLIGFALIFAFIYWCPITAYIIATYCIEFEVVWRMFWILPTTAYISYVLICFLEIARKQKKQWQLLGVLMVVLLLCGSTIYTEEHFQKAENPYKINQIVIDVTDVIKEDAENKWIENVGVIVPDNFVTEIKQYDGKLRMPYGRDLLRGIDNSEYGKKIHHALNNMSSYEGAALLRELALQGDYQYMVCITGADITEMQQVGYYYVETVGVYDVFCTME